LRTSNCSLLFIYPPRKDERLSRPGWQTYSGRVFTHISGHPSAACRASNNLTNSKSCMIYPMVPFPATLSNPLPRFQGHWVITDALDVLCAQLTRDLFTIAKFLFNLLPAMCHNLRDGAVAVVHQRPCLQHLAC